MINPTLIYKKYKKLDYKKKEKIEAIAIIVLHMVMMTSMVIVFWLTPGV